MISRGSGPAPRSASQTSPKAAEPGSLSGCTLDPGRAGPVLAERGLGAVELRPAVDALLRLPAAALGSLALDEHGLGGLRQPSRDAHAVMLSGGPDDRLQPTLEAHSGLPHQ